MPSKHSGVRTETFLLSDQCVSLVSVNSVVLQFSLKYNSEISNDCCDYVRYSNFSKFERVGK